MYERAPHVGVLSDPVCFNIVNGIFPSGVLVCWHVTGHHSGHKLFNADLGSG